VQTNNVDMQSESGCLATLPRILLHNFVGPDNVEQTRNSSHFVGGGKDDQTKVGPTIGVPVHVPVDVYSPAHDRIF